MRIDILCNDGSPLGIIPSDIYGRGVGGAELALVSWSEEMAKRDHTVRVYNNPREAGVHNGVEFLSIRAFNPGESRDVFIIFRSPNPHIRSTKAEVKLFWSCDQQTTGDFKTSIIPWVDRVVCISPYHVDYHRAHYNVPEEKIGFFDLGVRLQDYDLSVKKVKNQCIFCSIPDRGLDVLHVMWPRILEQVPDATLIITSDYRLWGVDSPGNHKHTLAWLHSKNVKFLGAIPRQALVEYQLSSDLHIYPCTYEELFCISSAECQVAGAYSLTSNAGALRSTNEFGTIVPGSPATNGWVDTFVNEAIWLLLHRDDLELMQTNSIRAAQERFDWQKICEKWEHLIETGQFV